jgi:DNA-binding CsgD family transcriptional regulator
VQDVVGREQELAAFESFLADARDRTAVFALQGAPGIGKTTLWRAGIERARRAGANVLTARATESEAGLSLTGLADLFGNVTDDLLEALPRPQAAAFAGALLRIEVNEDGVDERALFASVLGILRIMSAAGPVVVAVDDAQWLDTASARALSFAVRRLESEPVGFLVTVRDDGSPAESFDVVVRERRRVARVGSLTVAALHEVVKRETGYSLSRPAAVRVATASGGNPLHAIEIVSEMLRSGTEGGDLPVPPSLSALIVERVARLPSATQDALLAAAALARPTAELVDVTVLEPAEAERIVAVEEGRVRFLHPMFASAVYRSVDSATRRRVHLELATLVQEPEEQARHLALGATAPDETIAARLDAAAEMVAARGAPDAAAELIDLAVQSSPSRDGDAIARRRIAGARFRFDAGDLAGAETMLRTALDDHGDGPWRAGALQLLGQLHGRRSNFADALATASEALAAVDGDDSLRTAIELDFAYFYDSLGDFVSGQAYAQRAVESSEAGANGAVAEALAVLTISAFLGGQGLDEVALARALELEKPERATAFMMRPRYIAGALLLWTARCDDSIAVLDGLRAEMLERGEESAIPFLAPYRTWAALWRGDVADAARVVADARESATLIGDPAAEAIACGFDALLLAYTGPLDGVRAQAQRSLELFGGLQWMSGTIWPLWALGLAALAVGDPAAVDENLGPLAQMITSMESIDPVLGCFLPEEIEALTELGRVDEADALTTWLATRAELVDSAWGCAAARRCQGLVAAARGEHEVALAALDDATRQFEALSMPIERARTLLVIGRLQRRRKQKRLARLALEEAEATFVETGATVWGERARAELARVTTRRASATLTATEAHIAQLAAEGLTNREIAETVFVSTKTVEANLGRVYRKLGISSRAQLARALDDAPAIS